MVLFILDKEALLDNKCVSQVQHKGHRKWQWAPSCRIQTWSTSSFKVPLLALIKPLNTLNHYKWYIWSLFPWRNHYVALKCLCCAVVSPWKITVTETWSNSLAVWRSSIFWIMFLSWKTKQTYSCACVCLPHTERKYVHVNLTPLQEEPCCSVSP